MKRVENKPTDRYNFVDKEVVRSAAKLLGSIKSEKKAISSRENGKKGGRPKKITKNK